MAAGQDALAAAAARTAHASTIYDESGALAAGLEAPIRLIIAAKRIQLGSLVAEGECMQNNALQDGLMRW